MYKLYSKWLDCGAGRAGIIKFGLAVVLGLAAVAAKAVPANDNFTNATAIAGNGGTINGTTVGATLQGGEPIDAGVGGGKTIWYKWTAPSSETIEFDTEGSTFDTVIGIYTGTNITNLTLVAQNDDLAFPNDLTSQVIFPVVGGTTYFISVDGSEGDSGNVTLNWRLSGNFSAGQFSFAAPYNGGGQSLYIVSPTDSQPTSASAWMTLLGTRARVVRSPGSGAAGKVIINYTITNATFTNILLTNMIITNIFSTNIADNTFSNTFTTNFYAFNRIANFNGGFGTCFQSNSYALSTTNLNGRILPGGNNQLPASGFPFIAGPCDGSTNVTSGFVTNTASTNFVVTNVICVTITNLQLIPSATPGLDYIPVISGTTNMVDYQMGVDIPYAVLNNEFFTPSGTTNINPFDLVNHLVVIQITSVTLDPAENTNSLAPPVIVASTAFVQIQNDHIAPGTCVSQAQNPNSPGPSTTNALANFIQSVNWMDEEAPGAPVVGTNQRTARIWLRRTGSDATVSFSVNYVADQVNPPIGPMDRLHNTTQNPTFPLQPASDYATPPNPVPASKSPAHYTLGTGTVSWGANDFQDKSIDITVNYDPAVQFNEDLLVEIWNNNGANIGTVNTSTLTILFNDQPAGAVDRDHNPNNAAGTTPPYNQSPGAGGPQNTVYAAVVQPNNQTVFGGDFLAYDTFPRHRIARMNLDGSLDTQFLATPNSGADDTVTTLALQPDGKIVMGGVFGSFNGTNRPHIARLNTDGSLDLTFNPGAGANGTVWATALQPDGKVIIGGSFTSVNLTNRNYIARLNSNGSLDTNFVPGIGPNGTVNAIALQADGKIIIGGQFTSVGNTNLNYIARLNTNGTLDTTFNIGLGADQPINALAEQSDGHVLVGGAFTSINLTPRRGIARLNSDGSIDTTFDPGTGADDQVRALALQLDGGILMGGAFTSFNGTRRVGLARLYANGTLDTTFLDTAYNQFAGIVNNVHNVLAQPRNSLYTIGLQTDGNVIIGGHFTQLGGAVSVIPNAGLNTTSAIFARDALNARMNIARLIGNSTPGPGNIGLTYGSYSADKNGGPIYIRMERDNGALGPAQVNLTPNAFHAGAGNAVPGADYTQNVFTPSWTTTYPNITWAFSDDLFGPNDQTFDVLNNRHGSINFPQIAILNNTNSSGNQVLDLDLSLPQGSLFLGGDPIATGVALGRSVAPLTIVDNTVQSGTLAFTQPIFYVNESATNAIITVQRTNGSTGPITVQYQTIPGTGANGAQPGSTNDYLAVNGSLTFGSGETVKTFPVPIVDNFVTRPDREFTVYIYNPAGGAAIGSPSNSIVHIINDNFTNGAVRFTDTNYPAHQSAGKAIVSVIRLGGSAGVEKITYSTSDGSATNGLDYVATNGVLTWNSGDTTPKTFNVQLLNSGLVNSNTTINLQLSNPLVNGLPNANGLQNPSTAVVTIINDNFFGTPTLSASTYFVNDNGGGVVITVNRLGGNAQTITVDYSTVDGTAQAGVDYMPAFGTLTFTNGEISKSVFVPVVPGRTAAFLDFGFALSNPTPSSGPGGGVTLGTPSSATVTIIANQITFQPPGLPDSTFNPNAGFNGNVYALALQSNGAFVAGGDFTQANGIGRNRIARLNADGSLDIKFSSAADGANGSVRALAIQSDGGILVGGLFTTMNAVNENYIARLNFDGTLDSTFETGVGADNPIYAIAETFVGGTNAFNRRILVGGSFASIASIPYRSIAQLNNDGSVDTTFNASGANGTVFAIAVYSTNDTVNGGKILIGGDFTIVNSTNVSHVARLNADGSLDTTFNNSVFLTGPNDSVRSIAIQVDGKVVIGGLFTSVDGIPQNYMARLNIDGSIDATFNIGPGANDAVTALTMEQDLKVLVGGVFTQANGVTRNRLTRLQPDGTADAGINFGGGANDSVNAIVIQPDNKLVIAGAFTQFDGLPKAHIARLFGGTVTGPGAVEFELANYQVNQNASNIVITIRRVGGTGDNGPGGYNGPINVIFSTSDHTAQDGRISATEGVDYIGVTNLLTFQQGETFQSVTIPVLNDPTNMGQLLVDLSLTDPTSGDPNSFAPLGNQSTAELAIVGANSTVSFSAANYAVNKNGVGGQAIINVRRNSSSIGSASVDFMTTTNGTATPGLDFVPTTNTVVFADGETNELVLVPIINNGLAEGNLTVTMVLSNPTNTVLDSGLPTAATLTIVDNTLSPGKLEFSAPSYSVSQKGTNAIITIVRTNGSVGQVSVNYATSGGTATPGVDYIATSGTLTFLDGQLSKTFSVPVLNNTNLTSDVLVNLVLSSPTGGAQLAGPTIVPLTILDKNFDVSFAQAGYFVDEKNGSIVVGVNRFGDTNVTVSVNYATTNATAIAGVNYSSVNGTLTFNPGQTFQTFVIPISYDPDITGNLLFFVNLFTNTASGNPNDSLVQLINPVTTTVTILDDDSGFVLGSTTNIIVKGDTNAVISVFRLGNTAGPATVSFATTGGTAQANVEYTPTNGTLTFISGQTSNSFIIPIHNDNQIDGDRTVNIALVASTGGTSLLSPSNSILTIIDTESGVSFSAADYSVQENGVAATITVVRTGITNNTISVQYATSDGTAHAGAQYLTSSGTLVLTNGQTSATFQVPIIDNNVTGGSETVLLLLSNPSTTTTLVSPSAATLTILNNDGSLIVPAGSAVLSPANKVVSPGVSTTVLLALRNTAGDVATNVIATLQATNGITPSGNITQNYGNLVTNGPSVSRPFTFTANGSNGATVSAVLNLQYVSNKGTNNGVVSFSYVLGSTTNFFTNNTFITISDVSAATPYPSSITVTSVVGVISQVTATVSNLGHAYVSDVSMLLVGPAGQKELLMEQTGGKHVITNVTLKFDSTSANFLTTNAPTTGTYAPTAFQTNIAFPAATNGIAPPPLPYNTNLADFNGTNPNGTWSLFVDDTKILDTGSINNGWSLAITTLNVVSANVDLVAGLSASPSPVIVNSNLVYTIGITNAGPSPATGVIVSNVLPAGVTLLSVTPSQGTVTTNAGVLTFSIGNLATNGTASVTVSVTPTAIGSITNSVYVSANEFEDDVANNSAILVTTVASPTADLAIGATAVPNPVTPGNILTYTINVTNLGPGTATGAFVTNTIPPGLILLTNNAPFGYTNVAGFLTMGLGNMGSGASRSFTLVLSANAVGIVTNSFGVGSDIPDPLKGNNSASVKTIVQFVPLNVVTTGSSIKFTWLGSGYRLQSTTSLAPPVSWTVVPDAVTQVNGQYTVTLPISAGSKFFRLISP